MSFLTSAQLVAAEQHRLTRLGSPIWSVFAIQPLVVIVRLLLAVVAKIRFQPVAPIHHMVNSSLILHPWISRHPNNSAKAPQDLNTQGPFFIRVSWQSAWFDGAFSDCRSKRSGKGFGMVLFFKCLRCLSVCVAMSAGIASLGPAFGEALPGDVLARAKMEQIRARHALQSHFKKFEDAILQETLYVPNKVDPKQWNSYERSPRRESAVDVYPVIRENGDDFSLHILVSLIGRDRTLDIRSLVINTGGGPVHLEVGKTLKGVITGYSDRFPYEIPHEWVVAGVPDTSQFSTELRTRGMPKTIRVSGRAEYFDHELQMIEREAWDAAIAFIKAERMMHIVAPPDGAASRPAPSNQAPANRLLRPENDGQAGGVSAEDRAPSEKWLFDDEDLRSMGVDPAQVRRLPPVEPEAFEPSTHPGKIDVNTATAAQLESLPGIGPRLAAEIIRYRPYV